MAARRTRSSRTRTSRHRATPDKDAAHLGARVKARRLELDFSFDAFVEELGMGRGYLSELERGLVVPSLSTLYRLATALETTAADLVLRGTERERLFAMTEQLSPTDVGLLLETARGMVEPPPKALPFRRATAKHNTAVQLFRFRPTAGGYSEPQSAHSEWVHAPRGVRARAGLLIVQVEGHSMEPSIADGAYCLCQRPWSPQPGESGIFSRTEPGDADAQARYTIKEYRPAIDGHLVGGVLKPRNPRFAPLTPDPSSEERPFARFIRVLR